MVADYNWTNARRFPIKRLDDIPWRELPRELQRDGTKFLHTCWEDCSPAVGHMEAKMPVILWMLGVPLVVVVALMLTHVI